MITYENEKQIIEKSMDIIGDMKCDIENILSNAK